MRSDPEAVEQHEHQAWERSAADYADNVAFMTAHSGQAPLLIAAGGIERGSEVLDIGCGPGLVSTQLAETGANVVGVDFSANMVTEAERRFPALTFRQANVESLPFDGGSFDVAVCNYTAHHFARPHEAFTEVKRVLKDGGRLAIVHPIQARQRSFGSFAEAVAAELPPEEVPGGPLLDYAEPGEYESLLTECGYAECRVDRTVKPVEIGSLDELLTAGWNLVGLHAQPQDIQDRIEAGTRERAAQYRQDDGSYLFPDEVLVARAVK